MDAASAAASAARTLGKALSLAGYPWPEPWPDHPLDITKDLFIGRPGRGPCLQYRALRWARRTKSLLPRRRGDALAGAVPMALPGNAL